MEEATHGCDRVIARRSAELVPSFLKLLRDGEAEVRVAAAGKVAAFCKLLGSDTVRPRPRPRACTFRVQLNPVHFPSSCLPVHH